MYRPLVLSFCLAAAYAVSASADVTISEDFSSDPAANWSFGVGDNSNSQFNWNSSAASAYTGDPTGEFDVSLNSSLPSARYQRALGFTITDTDSFTLTSTFSMNIASAPSDQGMQIAFGLVNSATTGGNRTGTPADFSSDNTFSTVEFNYFPNASPIFGGPSLSPAVFGAQSGGGDAFGNFASLFGSASDLSDNTVGVTNLPQNVTLRAVLDYNGTNKTLQLEMYRVNSDGSVTALNTETPALDLVAAGYDTNTPFRVDTLAIMAYQDGFTTSGDPSLVADVQFQNLSVTAAIPEPSTAVLAGMGLVGIALAKRRRRS